MYVARVLFVSLSITSLPSGAGFRLSTAAGGYVIGLREGIQRFCLASFMYYIHSQDACIKKGLYA